MKKRRTPKQEWSASRWHFKGNLQSAKHLIYYHITHTPLSAYEFTCLKRIEENLLKIQKDWPNAQEITRP